MKLSSFLLLRIAIGFAFFYAGMASLLQPDNWIGYIPSWISMIIPADIFLRIHSILEIVLAIWLVSGKKVFWASLVGAAILFGIVVSNFNDLMIVFRDISLMIAALALNRLSRELKNS